MADFPPPPVNAIDWTDMRDSRVHEVNGHIECKYSKAAGEWAPLKFVHDPYMRIHGMSPALNYGQQILEGFKAFRMPGSPGGIALFRPDKNAQRFQHSAKILSMPCVPEDLFLRACRAAVALNAEYVPPHDHEGALYVRPQLYGSSAQLGLTATDEYTFCVFVVPTGVHLGLKPVKALILDDFDRAAPKGTGHAKVGGNYAPVLRWSDKARAEGYGITLHLDSARHEEVDEFSTCAFLGVRAGQDGSAVTLVVPDSPCVIDSVTSDSVQQIARDFGWNVEKRAIPYSELPEFSEILGSGTALGLIPVRSITRPVGSREKLPASARVSRAGDSETISYVSDNQDAGGPVYLKLLAQLKALQRGDADDEVGWRFLVQPGDRELE